MLDLSGINRFYELKWFDGTSVWLKKPTEEMFRKVTALAERDTFEAMDELKQIVLALIIDNEDGRKFPQEELDQLDGMLCMMIFEDYTKETTKRLGE